MAKFVTTEAVELATDFIREALPLLEPYSDRFNHRWKQHTITTVGAVPGGSVARTCQMTFTIAIRPFTVVVGNGYVMKDDDEMWAYASFVFQYSNEIVWKAEGRLRDLNERTFDFYQIGMVAVDLH